MQGRADALRNVESTISELGGIFTQLATMVAQQGELAIRFSSSIHLFVLLAMQKFPSNGYHVYAKSCRKDVSFFRYHFFHM